MAPRRHCLELAAESTHGLDGGVPGHHGKHICVRHHRHRHNHRQIMSAYGNRSPFSHWLRGSQIS